MADDVKYVTGLFDEHEFDQQRPPHHGFVAWGPFEDEDEAVEHARTLSTDPNEAIVIEVRMPYRTYDEIWKDIEKLARRAPKAGAGDGEMMDADQRELSMLMGELERTRHGD